MKRRTALKNIAALGAAIGIVPSVLGSDSTEDKWVLMNGDTKVGTFLNGEPKFNLNRASVLDGKIYLDLPWTWTLEGEFVGTKIDVSNIEDFFYVPLYVKKGKEEGQCFITNHTTDVTNGTSIISVEGSGPLT